MTDKTKSQTYNFLSENKSIEDIKQQPNIFVKGIKNKRHSGQTYRIDNDNNQPTNDDLNNLSENNRENLEPVTSNLTNNEKEQEINNDIWTKFKNYLNWPTSNTEELIQTQKKYIEQLEQSNLEKNKQIQQLKNEIELLKQAKQSDVNLTKFSYNAITIYDEKQKPKIIKKIHEEILPINNEIYFITTIQNIDNSINEEVIHLQQLIKDDIKIFKQNKQYNNIDDYKKDINLINDISTNNNSQFVPIKDFLKQQENFKLKPTATEKWIWSASWLIPITLMSIGLIHPPLLITTIVLSIVSLILKEGTELFSPISIKVKSWIKDKFYSLIHKIPFVNKRNLIKTKEQQETEKNIKKSIENLTSDKLETKLQTQYDILKQELDNRKDKNHIELISNNTINHNSNTILKNSNIETLKPDTFDKSIRNIINNQELQTSTTSNHNWNKVKCLLTT
ncbi:MAG: hypothetical protein PPFGHCPK_01350 (plasmid) [Spiroplasma endosymbiont of Drosophila atripex]|nr:MAG: hypothetical protein PPFGHCPK_01350 [Spiroplasma endosymbiont of Drosophila atripex]